MSSIKERIGQRIREERLAKGLTRKALAELTDSLKISRINNYERGERTPGPEEIQQLAKALEVSAAFLMCLSDDKQGKQKSKAGSKFIPLVTHQQATNIFHYFEEIKNNPADDKLTLIPILHDKTHSISEQAFALKVGDDSMKDEFRIHDILIVDPEVFPTPGDFVVAKLEGEDEVIIRKYKQLSTSKNQPEFELIALNNDWATVRVSQDMKAAIIGTIIQLNRIMK